MPEIDEKELEAVARAIAEASMHFWDEEVGSEAAKILAEAAILAYESAKAASAREVPEGWKLVPVEPTDEMMKAGAQTDEKAIQGGYLYPDEDSVGLVYAAMLSASPALPVMGAGET